MDTKCWNRCTWMGLETRLVWINVGMKLMQMGELATRSPNKLFLVLMGVGNACTSPFWKGRMGGIGSSFPKYHKRSSGQHIHHLDSKLLSSPAPFNARRPEGLFVSPFVKCRRYVDWWIKSVLNWGSRTPNLSTHPPPLLFDQRCELLYLMCYLRSLSH